MPGVVGILVPLVLAIIACVLAARLRQAVVRLSVSVGLSQAMFHAIFTWSAGHRATMPMAAVTHAGGSAGHGGHLPGLDGMSLDGALLHAMPMSAVAPMPAAAHMAGPGMWCAHLLAAVLTTGVLYRSEQIAGQLRTWAARARSWVSPHAPGPVADLMLPPALALAMVHREVRPGGAGFHLLVSPWRGPPARDRSCVALP